MTLKEISKTREDIMHTQDEQLDVRLSFEAELATEKALKQVLSLTQHFLFQGTAGKSEKACLSNCTISRLKE